MTEKHTKLLSDYAILQKFIRIKGFDSDCCEVAGLAEPAPIVYGLVLNTRKGDATGPSWWKSASAAMQDWRRDTNSSSTGRMGKANIWAKSASIMSITRRPSAL